METRELKPILESLIFAAEEPVGLAALSGILEDQGVGKNEIHSALTELMSDYNDNETKGLMLREVGDAWQFVTKPVAASFVEKLNVSKPKTLSQAALETISIIAYRQPVVRSEIEQIRGVDSGGVLKTLLERGYIKIV
ncbi:MAG: SMC-Scp complex subunit ScpB, partial [Deltaproteobacteria bacterium]|nr:SMC-Scp complex subunit ScpB [Deltaproteobacteria bacterium]